MFDVEPLRCCEEWLSDLDYAKHICNQAAAEIERLRAIVDKLPKTADGVPMTPGMNVYSLHWFQPWRITGFNTTSDGEAGVIYFGVGFDAIGPWYSTLEAAQQAKAGR